MRDLILVRKTSAQTDNSIIFQTVVRYDLNGSVTMTIVCSTNTCAQPNTKSNPNNNPNPKT